MDMADPSRGEIWLADLGTGRGHEQAGQRPVLVVSDDAFNAGLAGLVMTVPLTSKVTKSKNIPAHIRVDPPEGGLKTPSVILCDQLRTISKDRLSQDSVGNHLGRDLGGSGKSAAFPVLQSVQLSE